MISSGALAGLLALPAAHALFSLYSTLRGLSAMAPLPRDPSPPRDWPKLSLIVPACNEAGTIEAATRAKLASDYPNLELVLVDDRSDDGTSEIADRLAALDPRVRVVHVRELPPGWLGKVHALSRGVAEATGDWLLFSDADVHLEPDLLRRTMAEALRREAGFVVVTPKLSSASFALDVILATFMRLLVVGGRLYKVADPRSRAAVGGGTFNLVERSAWERTPGFEWLRLEIADDVALGQMMKRSGARCAVFDGEDRVHLHFYRSVGEMMQGLEKNGYAVLGGLKPWRALLTGAILLHVELTPMVALALPSAPARIAGALLLATLIFSQALISRAGHRSVLPALVPGVGAVMLVFFMLRSMLLTHARGGIVWRGTHYPLASLRSGQRLELF